MDVSQYTIKPKELVEILIKHHNIHDGKWFIGANFGFATGLFGTSPSEASPGVIVGLTHILLQRFVDGTPASAGASDVVVDAAKVNPKDTDNNSQ